MFQYSFHTRNGKTCHRGLSKHRLHAFHRCLWMNLRRSVKIVCKVTEFCYICGNNQKTNPSIMKTRYLLLGAILLSLCCFTSCNDNENLDEPDPDVIWDIYPFNINIEVTDAEGNDLLNPETENSIANQGIKMIYRNKTYKKDSLVTDEQTRDILVRFYGLQTYQRKDGSYLLAIGEFYGNRDYDNEYIILDWNDATPKDTITFSHKFWWENQEPESETTVRLNGVETDNPIHIIK